ncbi:MAG: hypothetical protein NTU80_10965 [Verrucomicrobia bacterium]|nr:hypothetical protein [Verrucomicrobiota bacterium]
MSTPTFDDLWSAATAWAEQHSAHIAAQGRSLTPAELTLASQVGVTAPERIRILVVPEIPFPDDPVLRAFAGQAGMLPERTGGMTLGHGIYLREDQVARASIWPHEFRHVAQYECFGSIKAFMFFYLKELLHFRYGPGPLETDARAAEAQLLAR